MKFEHSLKIDFYGAESPSPPDVLNDHGESSDAERLGAAVRIGSTPASRVMAVTAPEPSPDACPEEETIMTASPFCRSASELFGKRLNMRCTSGGPPFA